MTQNTKFLIEETVALSEKKDEVRFQVYINKLEEVTKVEQYLILKSFKTALPNTFYTMIRMYEDKGYNKIINSISNIKVGKEEITEYVGYFLNVCPEDMIIKSKPSPFLFRDLKPKTPKEIKNSIKYIVGGNKSIVKINPEEVSLNDLEGNLIIKYKNEKIYTLIRYNEESGYFEGLQEHPSSVSFFNTKSNAKYNIRTNKMNKEG